MSNAEDPRAYRNVAVLVAAGALLGSQMASLFTIGGLAGQSLASNICFATLPITMIVLGSMLTATPLSAIMQKYGRRVGFILGAMGGAVGASIAAYGLVIASFPVLLLGSLFTGMYHSAHGFLRHAAADTASEAFKPKAISYVMAGGLGGAFLSREIVHATVDAFPITFLGTYLTIIAINVVGSGLFLLLDIPKVPAPKSVSDQGRSRVELLKSPRVVVAIICGMVSYALMNLVMTSGPLAVVGCGFTTNDAADIVSSHVIAMYLPAFFTGHLIARFGAERIVAVGLLILAGAGATAISGITLYNFFGALILLGFGWNFGFIGATAMLAQAHTPEERGRAQGMNDMMVFGMVTVASFSSGGLMNCTGESPVDGWTFVNLAMTPFLMLAGCALIWLAFRGKRTA